MSTEFIRVASRRFRLTLTREEGTGLLVDVRDIATTFESQAIADEDATNEQALADSQVRDAIRSTYLNATSHESGGYPSGGTMLPADFGITRTMTIW